MARTAFKVALFLVVSALAALFLPDDHPAQEARAENVKGAGPQDLPLGIEKVYLQENRVFITIVRKPGAKIDPDVFSGIVVKVESGGGKPPRQWSLAEVNRNKALAAAGGRVELDTGIVLERNGRVRAVLSFGKWQTSKTENLPLPTAALPVKAVPLPREDKGGAPRMASAPALMTMREKTPAVQTRVAMPGPGGGRKVTAALDDSGGIRIDPPGSGDSFVPGANMQFSAHFLDDQDAGRITLELRRMSANVPLSALMTAFDPTPGRMAYAGVWPLPDHALPSGTDYYVLATHASGAWGVSDNFSIIPQGEGQIRVLRPRAGDGVTPGFRLHVDYQFSRRVSAGTITFELYRRDADGRHGRPLLTTTRSYRPGSEGTPEPIHLMEWPLPSDIAVGRHFVLLTHPAARGQSADFDVAWEMEAVFPSDYVVEDIFKERDRVKAAIRAVGGNIADPVEVTVTGSGTRQELIAPNRVTELVIGEIPAGYPCGAFYEVTIDPNGRLTETNERNNHLRKFVSFRNPDGFVTVPGAFGGTLAIPCPDYGDRTPEYPAVIVLVQNCSSGPVSSSGIVEVRQSGRDYDRVVPHDIFVSGCSGGTIPDRRVEPEIPPGECGVVRVDTENDLRKADSTLTYSFFGELRSWPSLTNPFSVQLDFGAWGTTIHTDTGRVEHQCVFDH